MNRTAITEASRIGAAALLVLVAASPIAMADSNVPAGSDDPRENGSTGGAQNAEPARRDRDASWRDVFHGRFQSSRLFAMPTAEVVGAFQLSMSGDASLLTEANTLSTSSVFALGFGDIAQLEYRNAAAVTTLNPKPFGLPTVGVQIKAPFRPRRYLPGFAVALRFGLPRDEVSGGTTHTERATDLYFVGRLKLWGPLSRLTLHGGLRVSAAQIESAGVDAPGDVSTTLLLPAGGWELQVTEDTAAVGELALVPRFAPGDSNTPSAIESGIFGRAGIRWRMLPWLDLDASVGYRIELEGLGSSSSSMASALVDWDIRLGGEIFVPWGAIACKATHVFCE